MASLYPQNAAATRKQSQLNANNEIHKTNASELRTGAHLPAIRLLPLSSNSVDATTICGLEPSSHWAPNTDARAPAPEMGEERQEVHFERGGHDERRFEGNELSRTPTLTTNDDCATGNEATHPPSHPPIITSHGGQDAGLGSLATYWSPWESELLQEEFWVSDVDASGTNSPIKPARPL